MDKSLRATEINDTNLLNETGGLRSNCHRS